MSDLFQDTPPAFDDGEEDPAADFLARDQDQLAALEEGDDFGFTGAEEPAASDEADLFGSAAPAAEPSESIQQSSDNLIDEFTSPAPIDMSQMNGEGRDSPYTNISYGMGGVRIEPEKIIVWREEQKQRLEEKDAAEDTQIDEMKKSAKKELDDWYRHREEQHEKTKDTNRAAEEAYLKEIEDKAPGSEFERIARLCDFNPKNNRNTRDVTRFRSILLQLKQSGLLRAN